MIPKCLGALILSLIITCVIFISCGDEGKVMTLEPPAPQQPTLEPPSQPQPDEQMPQPSEPQQPQPGEQMPEQPEQQQPQPQPEPPQVEQMPQPEPPAALPGLPDDVAGYDQWLKLNAEPIPPAPGADPHRGTKNVYVNQTREVIAPNGEQQFPYPDGTIIVKEATRPGKDFIGLIAVMWKEVGNHPDAGDWRFEEYLRGAPDAEFRLAFEGGICIGCHSGVAATDFVFVPLE